MFIQGERDEYGTAAQVAAIERQTRGRVPSVLMPRCGHSPHRDQSEATLSEIAGFVKSL